ncbi:MAG: 4a-hydroxytetrahydrobiopterin dehydratase [Myxococcota bacterium]
MPQKHTLLLETEILAKLAALPEWTVADGKLHRKYQFADFVTAVAFMTQVAFDAERLGHHPNWSNVYNRVEVQLWTHDAGGLTGLDILLAEAMESRATSLGG